MSICQLSNYYHEGNLTYQGEKVLYVAGALAGVALLVGTAVLAYFTITRFTSDLCVGCGIGSVAIFANVGLMLLIFTLYRLSSLQELPQEIPARVSAPEQPVKGLQDTRDGGL